MRPYIAITGILFALIVVAHIARGFAEGIAIFNLWYLALTLTCATLSIWAAMLLRKPKA